MENNDQKDLETRLDELETKLDRLLFMVEAIYRHVGFVDQLSNIFENIRSTSIGAATYAMRILQ